MKKIFVLLVSILIIFAAQVSAHAPSNIELIYDSEEAVLVINMTHVKKKDKKHFIRRIDVFLNEEKVETVYAFKQTPMSLFAKEIPLEAKEEDVIRIKAFCAKGGTREAEMTVPLKEEDKEEDDGQAEKAEEVEEADEDAQEQEQEDDNLGKDSEY